MSPERWDELCVFADTTKDKKERKNALSTLRRHGKAGELMETSEGVVAGVACYYCSRPGLEVECRVHRDGRRYAKAGCQALLAAPSLVEEEEAVEEDVEVAARRLAQLEDENKAIREELQLLKRSFSELQLKHENLQEAYKSDIDVLWEHCFPGKK